MWPSSSRNHKLSARVLEYQTRSKVWSIQGNPLQWHRDHQCHTHRTVPSSLLKNEPQNRAFSSCPMQGAMLCRWDFCIGHGKKYTTRNMISQIPSWWKHRRGEERRNVIPDAKYHVIALCGGQWRKCGLEDASGCESEGKADWIEFIVSRKEILFPVRLSH